LPISGELSSYRDLSSFILVIDPAVFGSADGYPEGAQQMIDELHACPPAAGVDQGLVPGEIERRTMERNRRDGIPVPQSVYNSLVR
jgi:ureidoglycolate dehydrogenase (NAD+)